MTQNSPAAERLSSLMYRVVKKDTRFPECEGEIVISDRRGEPLNEEMANSFSERRSLAETEPTVTYVVESF